MQSRNVLLAGLMMSLAASMLPASAIAIDASKLRITSPAIAEGATIPTQFTCSGANQSPPLSFSGIPQRTRSLALLMDDPDAPNGTFVHWVVYDIPPTSSGFEAGKVEGKQGVNSTGEASYMGPCPPPGKLHHYHFRLYALDATPTVGANPDAKSIHDAINGHIEDSSELIGIFGR